MVKTLKKGGSSISEYLEGKSLLSNPMVYQLSVELERNTHGTELSTSLGGPSIYFYGPSTNTGNSLTEIGD